MRPLLPDLVSAAGGLCPSPHLCHTGRPCMGDSDRRVRNPRFGALVRRGTTSPFSLNTTSTTIAKEQYETERHPDHER